MSEPEKGNPVRIRCFFDPWIRGGSKIIARIRDKHPGSYFLRTWYPFFGLKILKFLDVDPGSVNPASGMEKSDLG
jgi:hypothetical protein